MKYARGLDENAFSYDFLKKLENCSRLIKSVKSKNIGERRLSCACNIRVGIKKDER